jgi:hypothetical protein
VSDLRRQPREQVALALCWIANLSVIVMAHAWILNMSEPGGLTRRGRKRAKAWGRFGSAQLSQRLRRR